MHLASERRTRSAVSEWYVSGACWELAGCMAIELLPPLLLERESERVACFSRNGILASFAALPNQYIDRGGKSWLSATRASSWT